MKDPSDVIVRDSVVFRSESTQKEWGVPYGWQCRDQDTEPFERLLTVTNVPKQLLGGCWIEMPTLIMVEHLCEKFLFNPTEAQQQAADLKTVLIQECGIIIRPQRVARFEHKDPKRLTIISLNGECRVRVIALP